MGGHTVTQSPSHTRNGAVASLQRPPHIPRLRRPGATHFCFEPEYVGVEAHMLVRHIHAPVQWDRLAHRARVVWSNRHCDSADPRDRSEGRHVNAARRAIPRRDCGNARQISPSQNKRARPRHQNRPPVDSWTTGQSAEHSARHTRRTHHPNTAHGAGRHCPPGEPQE